MIYFQPVNLKQWMMFEDIKGVGEIGDFYATKGIRPDDLMLFHVGSQDSRYESGIYAYGTVTEPPFYSTENGENRWRVYVRFDRIRKDRPIITHQDCLLFTKQFRGIHAIDPVYDEMIRKILADDAANPDVRPAIPVLESRGTPVPDAKNDEHPFIGEQQSPPQQRAAAVHRSEDSRRLEKKLDSLIGAITTLYSEKNSAAETDTLGPEKTDRRFRIEATQGDAPVLMVRAKPAITGLIFTLKLYAMGLENSERCRVFFADENGEPLSEPQEIDAAAGKEYSLRFELKSSASEKRSVFLAVQGINAATDEVRQLIEFPVKIAFAADFGL